MQCLQAYIQYTYRGILLLAKVDEPSTKNSTNKKHTVLSLKNIPLFNFKPYCAIFLSKF